MAHLLPEPRNRLATKQLSPVRGPPDRPRGSCTALSRLVGRAVLSEQIGLGIPEVPQEPQPGEDPPHLSRLRPSRGRLQASGIPCRGKLPQLVHPHQGPQRMPLRSTPLTNALFRPEEQHPASVFAVRARGGRAEMVAVRGTMRWWPFAVSARCRDSAARRGPATLLPCVARLVLVGALRALGQGLRCARGAAAGTTLRAADGILVATACAALRSDLSNGTRSPA